jgi:ethanolamine utilization protein EutA
MCLFGTEISGTTLYLPGPGILPLRDLPILARLSTGASVDEMRYAVDLVSRSTNGGCIEIDLGAADVATVKQIGQNLAAELREREWLANRALVLFVSQNAGKTLGSYASDWGKLPVKLIVIDELMTRNARFASLGAMRDNVVPVSLYGLQ